MENLLNKKVTNNAEWENFVKGEAVSFLVSNELEKITIEDGNGRKATIKRNANGEYLLNTTYKEKM